MSQKFGSSFVNKTYKAFSFYIEVWFKNLYFKLLLNRVYEKLNIRRQKPILSLCKLFKTKNEDSGNKNQIKKDVQKFIKDELTSILINVNPKLDKKRS